MALRLLRVKRREDGNAIIDLRNIKSDDTYLIIFVGEGNEVLDVATVDGKYLPLQKFITWHSLKRIMGMFEKAGVDYTKYRLEIERRP